MRPPQPRFHSVQLMHQRFCRDLNSYVFPLGVSTIRYHHRCPMVPCAWPLSALSFSCFRRKVLTQLFALSSLPLCGTRYLLFRTHYVAHTRLFACSTLLDSASLRSSLITQDPFMYAVMRGGLTINAQACDRICVCVTMLVITPHRRII